VIAYRRGGALDSVIEGVTGSFFDEQTPDALARAVRRFETERGRYDAERIMRHARGFDRSRFLTRIAAVVDRLQAERSAEAGSLSVPRGAGTG
jgi:glycosyltransferase involved in cell wall biosynthesis